jgi:Predicted multitransmembrane protein
MLHSFLSKKTIRIVIGLLLAAGFATLLFAYNGGFDKTGDKSSGAGIDYEKASVLAVTGQSLKISKTSTLENGTQTLKLKILTGAHHDEIHTVTNYLSDLNNVVARTGQTVIVRITGQTKYSYSVSVYSYYRAPVVYGFILLFFIVLLVVGGRKGLKSIGGLVFSFICIIFLYIPMLMRGWQPTLASLIIAVAVTVVTMFLLDGVSAKAICAVIGTIAGVLLATGVSSLAGIFAHLTGFDMQDAEMLSEATETYFPLNITGLLFGCIIISALGAVMDVAMDIASAVYEMHMENPSQTAKKLFLSGLNIGRDVMGTMANTLIFAFTGDSLVMLLLIYTYNLPFIQLINSDLVSVEVIQGLSGCIAVVLTVPLVAIISSTLIPMLNARLPEKSAVQASFPAQNREKSRKKDRLLQKSAR